MFSEHDEKELTEWLRGKEKELVITIISRAALRALTLFEVPLSAHPKIDAVHDYILASFRQTISVSVNAFYGSREFEIPVFESTETALPFLDSSIFKNSEVEHILSSAIASTGAAEFLSRNEYFDSALISSVIDMSAGKALMGQVNDGELDTVLVDALAESSQAWQCAKFDCEALDSGVNLHELLNVPLLNISGRRIHSNAQEFIRNLEKFNCYTFWHDWYQGFLDGKPLDWNLQREVALIPDADWDKGPAHIAEMIEEIKARFLADEAPLAEKMELNPKTGKFFVTPIPARKPDLLNTTLEKTSDALDDALNGRNGLLADDRVARVLRRCFEKYTHNPERIEMDFVDAHAGLTRQMASGELADSEEILSLAEILKNGALDIRANHPDIAANRETRAARALQELTPEQKQQLADAQPVLEALTEGEAHQDMGADIPALINDMIGPVPDYAPPVGPAVRVVHRAAKMSLLASSKEAIEAIEKNSGFRMVRISLVLKSIIDIGLKIFGFF